MINNQMKSGVLMLALVLALRMVGCSGGRDIVKPSGKINGEPADPVEATDEKTDDTSSTSEKDDHEEKDLAETTQLPEASSSASGQKTVGAAEQFYI